MLVNFNNLYSTELTYMGYQISLNDVPYRQQYLTRKYYKGSITKEDVFLRAEVISFDEPVFRILSAEGSKEDMDKLLANISWYRKKRWFPYLLRSFIIYSYFWVSLVIGCFGFTLLLLKRFLPVLLIYILLLAIRITYTTVRKAVY